MKKHKKYREAFLHAASMMIFDADDFFGYRLCNHCKNAGHPEGGCKAFPGRALPDDILFGKFDHVKRHPEQDNNILFEPIIEEKKSRKHSLKGNRLTGKEKDEYSRNDKMCVVINSSNKHKIKRILKDESSVALESLRGHQNVNQKRGKQRRNKTRKDR